MSKVLSNIAASLLILLATMVLTALLRGPLEELGNQNRLKADVELAPWLDKSTLPQEEIKADGSLLQNKYLIEQVVGSLGVARINLENESGKLISNINLHIPSYRLDTAFFIKANKIYRVDNLEKIKIPDMAPGDKVTVIAWGSFSSYQFEHDFKSYSSEGKFRTEFYWPQNQFSDNNSFIDDLVDFFVWPLGPLILIILTIVSMAAWSLNSSYIKLLFTYQKSYEIEKARFWSNPRKFFPDWNLVEEKHYRPHALFGDPDVGLASPSGSSGESVPPEADNT